MALADQPYTKLLPKKRYKHDNYFQIDGYACQAEDFIDGIFINPVLPEYFYTKPMEGRTEEDMRLG